ncbi:unnamed protein product [Rotaria magnacalcarata]|uniref:Translation factor GUF1 homolog, mitochondrial n=1 Tax=Rotaria magnacalcarata TaxID=392030 RepID=A0A815V765_9BILA|nr:unnamed protein product [Rotaria magnacalcarata]CAF1647913.1 unnamed protein product [Rotaria magnacalcarata]CAF2045577.1 unnamed protein product [Rotaria magnacalcarata]CAF2122641.1 unnamed protein product [Rotaria magnacalcarata]CAF3866544.1 unnamed protein product [Rotaria magnacalcarata]
MKSFHFTSLFLKRTLGSLKRIYAPCRFQHAQNPPPLVVERALRSIKMDTFETPLVRNFCIIAHVDHGKSTLADRLLELTGAIPKSKENRQVLDKLDVERERGITVKAAAVSMFYPYKNQTYLLNLIDTPGHVDFSTEVARSLSACQSAILLVDAAQGIQAQTVANFLLACDSFMEVIAIINKIDLKEAKVERTIAQIESEFGLQAKNIIQISAKNGTNCGKLLEQIVEQLPPPNYSRTGLLRLFVFDSVFSSSINSTIINVAVTDGIVRVGDKIASKLSGKTYTVLETGIFMYPDRVKTDALYAGHVGYIICDTKHIQDTIVGDTFYHQGVDVEPLQTFKVPKAMVFAGFFPFDEVQYNTFEQSIERLALNDTGVRIVATSNPAFGKGMRIGFLGLLHMEIFNQRLESEFSQQVITTFPGVAYQCRIVGKDNIKEYGTELLTVSDPLKWPDTNIIRETLEPIVDGQILTPTQCAPIIKLICDERRGVLKEEYCIDEKRTLLKYKLPLAEIVYDFFDQLKQVTSGYGTFDYEDSGYEKSNIVKLRFCINNEEIDELSVLCHAKRAQTIGKEVTAKLKENIDRQQYAIKIEAKVHATILARQNIPPYKKDVGAKLYGGDKTRLLKLLKRQEEGKERMRSIANIQVPRDAIIAVLKRK